MVILKRNVMHNGIFSWNNGVWSLSSTSKSIKITKNKILKGLQLCLYFYILKYSFFLRSIFFSTTFICLENYIIIFVLSSNGYKFYSKSHSLTQVLPSLIFYESAIRKITHFHFYSIYNFGKYAIIWRYFEVLFLKIINFTIIFRCKHTLLLRHVMNILQNLFELYIFEWS